LALPQNLRELAHRQFHYPQQLHDPQPRRIGKRLEAIGKLKGEGHEFTI
jgi:hypothetical protein